jgi:hypothetical protein
MHVSRSCLHALCFFKAHIDIYQYVLERYAGNFFCSLSFALPGIYNTLHTDAQCKAVYKRSDTCCADIAVLCYVSQNSMDLAWSGTLRYSAIGSACGVYVTYPMTTTGIFPANRHCTTTQSGSNDPDPIYGTGNSGNNGRPIGMNPHSSTARRTTGTDFTEAEDVCRMGRATTNPCAYNVGSEQSTAASLEWTFTSSVATSLLIRLSRDVLTPIGATFSLPLSSLSNSAGSVSTAASSITMEVNIVRNGSEKEQSGWLASWAQAERTLTITAGSDVFPGEPMEIVVSQLTMTSSTQYLDSVLVRVNGGRSRTTLIVRNGATLATYTTLAGDPVGTYSAGGSTLTIAAGNIVSARVYAYNGRFKSVGSTSLVQARAISQPQAPAYFAAQSQTTVGVVIDYTPGENGQPTDFVVKITPPVDLLNGTSVVIVLPGFDGPNYAAMCPTCSASVLDTQGEAHAVFTAANWVKNTSSIILIVGEGATAVEGTEYEVKIPGISVGIKYPEDPSVLTRDTSGMHVTLAYITHYRLDWVSPFPTVDRPRKGFMVQMTTDRNWLSDIQTVVVEDRLSGGVGGFEQISALAGSVFSTNTTLMLQNASALPILSYTGFVGGYIKVNNEFMRVMEALSTTEVRVLRGRRGTVATDHADASAVYSVYLGATDPLKGVFPGIDRRIGTAGTTPKATDDGCLLGVQNFQRGCNVALPPVQYISGLRSFQTAYISAGMPLVLSLSNCGTSGSLCTASSCLCPTPTLEPFADLGSIISASGIYVRNTADPLQWSNVPASRLQLAMTDSATNVVLQDGSMATESYLRIDDELVFVRGGSRSGVISVSLYQAFGTAASGSCSCSLTGAVSGGGTCSCLPSSQVTNCNNGGTLRAVGGAGTGFSATFTVGGGAITGITVLNPGYGFISIPEIVIGTGGDGCVFGQNLRFLPRLSTQVVQVERGAFGTTAVAHSLNTHVSLVTWPLRDNPGSPGTQYYFRIAAYNDAGISDYLYYKHKITEMSPNVFATTGGTPVEVTMEGGGHFAGNTTVYVGHTNLDGTIDLSR